MVFQMPVLRVGKGQHGELSLLQFEKLAYDLSVFSIDPKNRTRKPNEYFFWELLWPEDELSDRDRGRFTAQGHDHLTAPLYGLAVVLVASAIMLGGHFSRRGYLWQSLVMCCSICSVIVTNGDHPTIIRRVIAVKYLLTGLGNIDLVERAIIRGIISHRSIATHNMGHGHIVRLGRRYTAADLGGCLPNHLREMADGTTTFFFGTFFEVKILDLGIPARRSRNICISVCACRAAAGIDILTIRRVVMATRRTRR